MRKFIGLVALFIGLVLSGCATFGQRELLDLNSSGHAAQKEVYHQSVGIVEGDYTGQPADTNTITIGTTTYEFDSGGGVTPGNTAVTIGGDADTTYASLVTAIDSGADAVDADVPVAGRLRIRTAFAAGANKVPSSFSVAVSETTANFDWRGTNTNQVGRGSGTYRTATCQRTVDALFPAAASARVCEFLWAPTRILAITILDSGGAERMTVTDQFTLSGNAVVWTSAGVVHIADTDTVSVTVEE